MRKCNRNTQKTILISRTIVTSYSAPHSLASERKCEISGKLFAIAFMFSATLRLGFGCSFSSCGRHSNKIYRYLCDIYCVLRQWLPLAAIVLLLSCLRAISKFKQLYYFILICNILEYSFLIGIKGVGQAAF